MKKIIIRILGLAILLGVKNYRELKYHQLRAATLQAAQAGDKPILIRIETSAGHGSGKPTNKLIDETTDRWAFLVHELGMKPEGID